MTYLSNSRRRAALLTAVATLATGVALAVLPTAPASAAGTADRVCAVARTAGQGPLLPGGNQLGVALVGNSQTACLQAQRAMAQNELSVGRRVSGPCATVIHNFLPHRNAAALCATIRTQWQPITTPGLHGRTFYLFNNLIAGTCHLGVSTSSATRPYCI
jgi:hypothetical protein